MKKDSSQLRSASIAANSQTMGQHALFPTHPPTYPPVVPLRSGTNVAPAHLCFPHIFNNASIVHPSQVRMGG